MDRNQQHQSYSLGMWIFLGSELMLFGGLFLAYSYGRFYHQSEFARASLQLEWLLGAVNTAVLLTSSTVMAFAVDRGERGDRGGAARRLWLTALLGLVFLGIKGYEWSLEHSQGVVGERLFFFFYFTLTGLHAFHLTLGVLAVLFFAWRAGYRSADEIMILGLYWHLVDLLWFFLYPLLYLIGTRP
ncbi:MAG: cytochrome c oxidase subunit 3 [Candidatus Eremiobacteraeota bacterium]|nr:cytochrome c oxidase subunit 3 [Candidatus Eremiobacteraeota bacterium]MCW5869929.1 cytochrome c oxidase subunit 3 [Candidatus Eremiobacteraeota bacterium]